MTLAAHLAPRRLLGALIAALALAGLAAPAAEATELQPVTTVRHTDLAQAGFGGMRGNGTGSIALTGVTGTVTRAVLYWQGPTNGDAASNASVTFAGTPVTGVHLGESSDNCWGFANSHAYRADVTQLVNGDGTYALSNFRKDGIEVNGASLLVFFRDGSATNNRDVNLFDGNDSNVSNSFDGSNWNANLSPVTYESGGATLRLHVSDGQPFSDGALTINGSTLVPAGPIFEGDSVPGNPDVENLWDIEAFDISNFVASGSNSLLLQSPVNGDCLSLVAAAVDVGATTDTTAPDTSITAGPGGSTTDTTPTFEFGSDDWSTTFQCSVDGGPFTSCRSPHTTAALGAGSHTFRVRAVDGAGNVDATPASRSFTVSEPPTTTPPPQTPSEPVPVPLALSLDPGSAERNAGELHEVAAKVERSGSPVGDVSVRYEITGANPGSGSAATGADGRALVRWRGQRNGDDTLAAYADENGDGTRQDSEPQATATVRWKGGLPASTPVAPTIEQLPDPKPFKETNVEPERGRVFVRLPRSRGARVAQVPGAPKGYIPITQAAQLPIGTIIQADRGQVKVESAANRKGSRTQTAQFFSGTFQMVQRRARRPITEMVLKGGSFRSACRSNRAGKSTAGDPTADASRRRGKRVRRLWGRGRGRFRTRGRYSSATVRGTTWLVEDRCNGTLTKLPKRPRSSKVTVRDFVARRTITLRAGRSYFAAKRR